MNVTAGEETTDLSTNFVLTDTLMESEIIGAGGVFLEQTQGGLGTLVLIVRILQKSLQLRLHVKRTDPELQLPPAARHSVKTDLPHLIFNQREPHRGGWEGLPSVPFHFCTNVGL